MQYYFSQKQIPVVVFLQTVLTAFANSVFTAFTDNTEYSHLPCGHWWIMAPNENTLSSQELCDFLISQGLGLSDSASCHSKREAV